MWSDSSFLDETDGSKTEDLSSRMGMLHGFFLNI